VLPKKCGHMDNKQVIGAEEFANKICAAVAARQDPDFVLIARTDARAPHGLDDAINRGRACIDAGADALFVEALQSATEIETVATAFAETPLLFNWAGNATSPHLTYADLADLGFAIAIVPIGTMLAATRAMQGFLDQLKADGTPGPFGDNPMTFEEFTDTIGLPEIAALERRYS